MIEEKRISEILFHLKMTSRGLLDLNTGLRNSAENSVPYNHVKDAIIELKECREWMADLQEQMARVNKENCKLHASINTLADDYKDQGRVAEAREIRGLVK